jgi:hypothetical protein
MSPEEHASSIDDPGPPPTEALPLSEAMMWRIEGLTERIGREKPVAEARLIAACR